MSKKRYIHAAKHETSYEQFMEDLKRIIEKNQRNISDFDTYEISITLWNTKEPENIGTRSLMYLVDNEIFENKPEEIRDEDELGMIIANLMIDNKIEAQYIYDHLYNFFKVFITLNHDGNLKEFEEEYKISYDDVYTMQETSICIIMNIELAWMGLPYRFSICNDDTYNFIVTKYNV